VQEAKPMFDHVIRGPILIPNKDGSVVYHSDGAIAFSNTTIEFAGPWANLPINSKATRHSDGVILPPLLDIHTHIPQHPIRGKFAEGISAHAPGGKLLNALKQNVFPAEIRFSRPDYARAAIQSFLADTLSHGVVGGAAYMTVSAQATEIALEILPETWSVGLVLMNQNCPEQLRTDELNLEADITRLAARFGPRFIVTDRFAVATSTPLRKRATELAKRFNLRTQTHLNEQQGEKHFVEKELYPDASSYTDVYLRDGLLDHGCIITHCIHMRPDEWKILVDTNSVIAHCPSANLLLESGLLSLDAVLSHKIRYAIGTDVGSSPTVSMLAEMNRFLQVHAGRSSAATPTEALYRATLAPAQILGLKLGRLEPGQPASFIEAQPNFPIAVHSADHAIRALLPNDLDNPAPTISRVTVAGKVLFERSSPHA
jgi:guanine deaminase